MVLLIVLNMLLKHFKRGASQNGATPFLDTPRLIDDRGQEMCLTDPRVPVCP